MPKSKEMTKTEREKMTISATRKKQVLDILRLKLPHGDLSVYQRMHAEGFLKMLSNIAGEFKELETYNDILLARDRIDDLKAYPDSEMQQVVEFIEHILDEMVKAHIYSRKQDFVSLKHDLINMLDDEGIQSSGLNY